MEHLSDDFPLADIAEWLAGTASPDAVVRVDRWAGETPARRVLLRTLERSRGALHVGTGAEGVDESLALKSRITTAVLRRVDRGGSQAPPAGVSIGVDTRSTGQPRQARLSGSSLVASPVAQFSPRWLATRAAALGGLAVVAITVFVPVVRRHVTEAFGVGTPLVRTYATHRAQQATITLPDGSSVTLAPETELLYRDAHGARLVTLRGAASFTVTHDPRHPFAVQSGSVSTTVLGTQFTVQHYAQDRAVVVSVDQGKVAVSANTGGARASLPLTAGMAAVVTDSTQVVALADSLHPVVRWTSHELFFREVAMSEVLITLTRWYGVEFRLADSSLTARSLTAALDAQSLANALNTIKPIWNVEFTFDGNIITLHTRRAHAGPDRFPRGRRDGGTLTHTEVGR